MTSVHERLDPEAVVAAAQVLRGKVVRTPVLRSPALDDAVATALWFKAESLQLTGSFKVRGALNKVQSLDLRDRERGLVTVSAGNAAIGAAHAAAACGAELTVVMPVTAVPEKLAAVAAYPGVTVDTDGIVDATAAFARLADLQQRHGFVLVHPFDDPAVVAGAGTAVLELLEEEPSIERLLVPASGCGLLAGALLAVAVRGRPVHVVAVQPAGNATLRRSLELGVPTPADAPATVADGLTAPRPGHFPLAVVAAYGVDVVEVSEASILAALRLTTRSLRVVVEPSAVVGVAALLEHEGLRGARTATMLTGSNIRWDLLRSLG